jgi:hypothetical protein
MIACKGPLIHPAKRTLHCIYRRYFNFIKHGDTGSCLFRFLIAESGIVKREKWANFGHKERIEPRFLWVLLVLTAIHEYILSSTVTMEVAKDHEFSFFGKLL